MEVLDSFKKTVHTRDGSLSFTLKYYPAEDEEDLYLPEGYYLESGIRLDFEQSAHYEIRILGPHVWKHPLAEHLNFICANSTEKTEEQLYFVDFRAFIQNEEEAEKVVHNWCIGTAYTMKTKKPFRILYDQFKTTQLFREFLKNEHGIYIANTKA